MTTSESEPVGLYQTDAPPAIQREQFTSGEIPVAVYGLGKMGLPLAAVYAERTGNTIGVDIDEDVVSAINDGTSHIKREPGLGDLVADVVDRANHLLGDTHAAIGPSHFMRADLDDTWIERIWRHSILPYVEELRFGEPGSLDAFRLDRLREQGAHPGVDANAPSD